jgi:phage regulator Rha-like protein
MFQLTLAEVEGLRCQIGTSNEGRGGRRYLPYVFTEHGVAMLASVLSGDRAVQMSILIVRAFVRMRELISSHEEVAARVRRLESTQDEHSSVIGMLADEIDELKRLPAAPPKRRIGFTGSL